MKLAQAQMGLQICKKCVMDTTVPDITFDEEGICNYCRDYFVKARRLSVKGGKAKVTLQRIVKKMKENGKNNKYDCLLGVSGGTDSSYVAYLAKKLGLCVLLLHFDNGWNTEIATKNIETIVEKTGFDLLSYQVDYIDLQLAYLKASVVDVEVPTDHAILALTYRVAREKNIRYVLVGSNVTTEGILPKSWVHNKRDLRNLKTIHKSYGEKSLETFPKIGLLGLLYYRLFKRIQFVRLLHYVDYNVAEAKNTLRNEFDWQDYGEKHCESLFTKFFQRYILPTKFNIDKRKAHLSALICSGQITREQALQKLKDPLYDETELEKDKQYVLNKLGLSEKQFQDLMALPIRKHEEYGTDEWIYSLLRKLRARV